MRKHLMLTAAVLAALGNSLPTGASAAAIPANRPSIAEAPVLAEKARDVVIVKRRAPRVVVVRPWHRRPHYGTLIGGIALGTLLAASIYYARPEPPAPGLCWYWANPSRTRGYWDYCD
jgi:hypothetical protein